jgi:hypothetical protein
VNALDPSSSASRRRGRWRSVWLSGLVFPGLGQLMCGRPLRGLAFATGSLIVAVALVLRVARETLARLPTDLAEFDPLLPLRLAHEIQRDNAGFFFWITLVLVALWAGSIADAWWTSRSR